MSAHRKQLNVFIVSKPTPNAARRWTNAGIALFNDDGSITVMLDTVPLNGRLELREAPPTPGGFFSPKVALA